MNATSHASCLRPPNKPNNVIIKPTHLHYSIKNHTLIPYTYFHSWIIIGAITKQWHYKYKRDAS